MGSSLLPTYRKPLVPGSTLIRTTDPDAQAIIDAITTAGGTIPDGGNSAINTFVLSLKNASIWTPMIGLYGYVGGTAASHAINWKTPGTLNITWGATALTHDANGITAGGGTSANGNTGINVNTTTANSLAYGFYSRTSAGADVIDMGAVEGAVDALTIFANAFGGNGFFDNQFNGGAGRAQGATTNGAGLFTSSRTAGNSHIGYRNATSVGSTAGAQGTLINANIYVCTRNQGEPSSTRNFALNFVSAGLTAQNVTDFYAAVQALQTSLGRQV